MRTIVIALLFVSSLAWGQAGYKSDVAQGSITLLGSAVNAPLPGAGIRVCVDGSVSIPCTLATIYTDRTKATTATNPFTADASGNYAFYAAPGWYNVQISGAGFATFNQAVLVGPDISNLPPISTPSITTTGAINGATVTASGAVNGATVTASGAVSGAIHIGPSGNQGITVKDINVGTAFTAFGDSITQGFNASDAAHDYVGLIAAAKGWTATNDGVASTQLSDSAETDTMFAQTVTSSSIYTILAGHNDMRANFNATQEAEWQANLYSTMAWLAIPDANKIKGTAAGCVYAGTWITSTIYGGAFAKASTANASTATCTTTIPSTVVYFNYLKQVLNTSTFTLTVDGVSVVDPQSATGSTTFASLGHITTGLARNFEPQMVRISDLAPTVHTVVMTVVSADNSGGNSPYVVWVGSPSASASILGPYVYLGNTVRLKSSDYAGFGGSDALVGTFNALSLSVASDLANDGLNVDYVDAASAYNPNDPTQYSTSSVGNFPFFCTGCPHPSNVGQGNVAGVFLFEMSGLTTPRDRMAARAFSANGFSTAGGALHVGGFCNQQALGDGCFSRSPTSGGLHFGNNGAGVIFQPNSSSMQFFPGNTGFPIAFDFGVAGSVNYPRLKIPSAGAVQLRNTADSADLPLEVLTFNAGGGTLATPAFSFSAEPASGWFRQQAGIMGFGIGGSYLTQFRVDRVGYAPGVCVGWAIGAPNANSDDTTLCRSAVSTVKVGNGAGGFGTVQASFSINGGTTYTSQTGTGSSVASSTGNAELFFLCRGVATASSTIALDFGTCTGTTGLDVPVSAGTLANLRCSANNGGVNASSGVVTVRKNTVNQTMTCTFGTATTCSDTAHPITMAAGDRVGMVFTTQVAETLNQVSCSIEKQ